jgi:hypothetical protein
MNDERLCALLAAGSLLRDLSQEDFAALWEGACANRVEVLLAAILSRSSERIPEAAHQQVVERLREATVIEMIRHRELRRLVAAFNADHIDVLLLKGAGLAYTVYAQPHLRQADDIDLLIRRDALGMAERALLACGYERAHEPDAELASSQRHYVHRQGRAVLPWVDLHWRVANPQLFIDALSFEDAWAHSVDVPSLGFGARTLGVSDALLLGCVHRVAHHQDRPDLLWIWDLHLLARRMTFNDEEMLLRRAEQNRMRAVAVRGLELATDRFRTRVTPDLLGRLKAGPKEPGALFLGGGLRQVDVLRADLAAMGSLQGRLQLLREHLFPPRAYLRASYDRWPEILLPLAYLDRIVRGARKWFRRPSAAVGARDPSAAAARSPCRTHPYRLDLRGRGDRSVFSPWSSTHKTQPPGAGGQER